MPVTSSTPLLETNLPGIEPIARGKVRDIYDAGEHLLFVATDRISAFDVVLPNGIPHKGEVLTKLSMFWFNFLKGVVPTHFVTANLDEYPENFRQHREQLDGRSMLVKKLDMIPIECVARGYISGSGWKDYQKTGAICGVKLPDGLRMNGLLAEPVFTPATKAETGHDENITFEQACGIIGEELCAKLRDLTLEIYMRAGQHALACGVVLADTKFEFGRENGEIILADEVLTPDSSRYWPLEFYQAGKEQVSFDKQFVRDYLETLEWDKTSPGPELPANIVAKTAEKYLEAYYTLTSEDL
ncbi:MAG TPA: phosphoribosylaminoimidazolesuccinocarboxamide synthase [Bryobacterales bacterium]|nr:phosphoribosylaminoimidazolesuccinocarboxamide synthase [Bryobacterales bacterium]